MKSPTVEDRDTSLRANIATIIQESRTTQEAAFEVADRVEKLVLRDRADAETLQLSEALASEVHAVTELKANNAALTAQVALLREALEEADAALVNVRRLGVVYTYPEDWRCHKEGGHPPIEAYDEHDLSNVIPDLTTALAATPESAGAELAELRKDKARIDAWEKANIEHGFRPGARHTYTSGHFLGWEYANILHPTFRVAMDAAMQQEAKS